MDDELYNAALVLTQLRLFGKSSEDIKNSRANNIMDFPVFAKNLYDCNSSESLIEIKEDEKKGTNSKDSSPPAPSSNRQLLNPSKPRGPAKNGVTKSVPSKTDDITERKDKMQPIMHKCPFPNCHALFKIKSDASRHLRLHYQSNQYQ